MEQEELIGKNKGKNKDSEMISFEPNSCESSYLNNKAHKLHSAHTMNEQQKGWFQSPASDQENLPTYLKQNQKQQKQPEPDFPTSQYAFNINKNCYESLPVHQTSYNPYSPYQQDFYPHEFQYFKEEEEEEETLALAPSLLPLGTLYENIMDFMEITIVQYVCQRTHPSPFRLAAETLARSKLNPNAKEFTPMVKTNSVIKGDGEMEEKKRCRTPEQSDEMDEGESIEESSNHLDLYLVTENKGNVGIRIETTNERQQTSSTEQKLVADEPNCSNVEGKSSEYISHEELMQYNASDNSFCDSNITTDENHFVLLNEDDSDDDCFDDDDDDSDWDSDEQSTGQCVEIDPSEFEDLFPSPLLMTNLRVCKTKSSNPELLFCPVIQSQSTTLDNLSNQPSRTISDINKKLFDQDQAIPRSCRKSDKSVQFCDDVNVIEEPDDLADDLQNARISDFPGRQADKERMERLLAPILTEVHRGKMYQKIYGGN